MFDKELLALLGKDKKYIIYIVIFNLLIVVSNVGFALSLCWIVDKLIINELNINGFINPIIMALVCLIIRFVCSLLVGHYQAVLGSNSKIMLRNQIYSKVARLGTRESGDLSLASLSQVSTEGVEQLDLYYSTYIPQFFFSMMSPFLLFALLMFICVPSAVILICCVPLIPMSIIAVSKYAKKIFAKYWGQYTKMGDAFLDNISGMKELKIFNADKMYQEKMNNEAELFRKITMKVLTMQLASTTIMDLVAYAGAGLGISLAIINNGSINTPFLLSSPYSFALFIVLVAVDFFLPLRALGSAFHVSMNGATAGRKILNLLKTPEPVWGNELVDKLDISFENVSFGYTKENKVLNGLTFSVNQGKMLVLVGKSGCGKSTIVSLLAGLKGPYEGKILIGDKELHSLDRSDFYNHVGLVSYNTYIFAQSVKDNFLMIDNSLTDKQIYEYLDKVNLTDFIKANGGLDLIIKEDSLNISGGQRQRLALAINLASNKDIYLFDEITSNIDVESEEIIMKNIVEMKNKKTIILISHRLQNALYADEILYLENGKAEEIGDFNTLVSKGGKFNNLYLQQKNLEDSYKEVR